MTRLNRHRIQRQVIDLAIATTEESAAVQHELARPFWDRAVPELEHVFDSAAGAHELLRLDRLELDLGMIAGADWTTEFRRKLVAELTRSLASATVSSAGGRKAGSAAPLAERWKQFLFFLAHGHLPWWGTRPTEGWTDALLEESDTAGWNALRETVFADPRARVRLVDSVSDEFLDRAIGRWAGAPHAARVLEQLTPTDLRAAASTRWRRDFWTIVLDCAVAAGGLGAQRGPQLMRALRTVRNTYVSQTEEGGTFAKPSPADSESAVIPPAPGNELPSPWHEWMSQSEAGDVRPAAGRGTDDTTAVVHPPTIASPPGALPLIPEARGHDASAIVRGSASRSLEESRKRDERHRPSEQGDAIYLEGAGAILLHPFLEPLFRDRGLLAGRSFRDTDARDRAVRLLGLLTFGSADVPEYELVLAKALCGCAFEEPLEPVQLDDHDIAACDALLRAVLGHWTALRSSSPEWMRQQFFLREGKLERVDEGYRLTIERRAQDVLLARLPWGCGFVALPWLADRIFVRWLD